MGSSRGWKDLTLPTGEVVQTTQLKREELKRSTGVDPLSDLTKLKGAKAKDFMTEARRLMPDQVTEPEAPVDNLPKVNGHANV